MFSKTRLVAAGLAAMFVVAGCSSSSDDAKSSDAPKTTPTRVASVGVGDVDTLLALGIKPELIVPWSGAQPNGVGVWSNALLGDAKPQVVPVTGSISDDAIEKIAAVKPDAIVAVNTSIEDATKAKLNAIAPTTFAPPQYAAYMVPWDVKVTTIGQAVGLQDKAAKLIEDTKAKIASEKSSHPQYSGRTAAVVVRKPAGGFAVYGAGRAEFIQSLGYVMPPALAEKVTTTYYGEVSEENLNLLDVDTLIVLNSAANKSLADDAAYQNLSVVKNNRVVYLNADVSSAISSPNPVTISWVLDQLIPQLPV